MHEIMKEIPGNIERIIPTHMLPPWQMDTKILFTVDTQYATRLTTNPAQRGITKRDAADEHHTRVMQISSQDDYIITYTDGSMKEEDQDQNTEQGQDGWHTGRG